MQRQTKPTALCCRVPRRSLAEEARDRFTGQGRGSRLDAIGLAPGFGRHARFAAPCGGTMLHPCVVKRFSNPMRN